jgi:outer membrane protein assembly factor BamB
MNRKAAVLVLAILMVSGCSTVSNIFQTDKEKADDPVKLAKISNPITIKKLWSVNIGKGEQDLSVRQKPAVDVDAVYAADSDNNLVAIDRNTGKIKWTTKPNTDKQTTNWKIWESKAIPFALTGGPAVYSGLVALGGRNGEVFAFNAADGKMLWKSMVSSSVISAPLITFDTVIVRANDGKVHGLDLSTGAKKWQFDRGVPTLSVRGNGSPVLGPGMIFVGFEDGSLIALNQQDGKRIWEQLIAKPDGRTELDRMADIDGEIQVGDREVFATSYHNSTMALAINNGQPIWVREIGGYAGVGLMSDRLFISDKNSNVWAMDRNSGNDIWKQEGLLRHGLTTPVVQGNYVVLADKQGKAHWLDSQTGEIKALVDVGGAVLGSPVVSDDGIVYIQTVDGTVSAYSLAQ